MSEDRELKIRITGDASGITAAAGDASGSLNKLGEQTRETARETDKLEFSHRGLHRALDELNQLAPGVGAALSGALYGPIGPAVAVGAILVQAVRHFQELREAAQAAAEAVANTAIAMADVHVQAEASFDKYLQNLANVKTAIEALKAAEGEALSLIKDRAAEEEKIFAIKEKIALAAVAGDKEKEDAVRQAFGEGKDRRSLAEESAIIAQMEKDRDARQAAQPGLEAKTERDAAATEKAEVNLKKRAPELDANIALAKQIMEEAAKQLQRDPSDASRKRFADASANLTEQEQAKQRAEESVKFSRARVEADEAEAIGNKKAIGDFDEKIGQGRTRLGMHTETFQTGLQMEQAARLSQPGVVSERVQGGADAVAHAAKGMFSDKDKDAMAALKELTEATGLKFQNIVTALKASLQHHEIIDAEVKLFTEKLNQLTGHIHENRGINSG